MKHVTIEELQLNLRSCLREVGQGMRILVSDREHVVAELRAPRALTSACGVEDLILSEWVARKAVVKPLRVKEPLPDSPVRLSAGSATALLEADRRDDS